MATELVAAPADPAIVPGTACSHCGLTVPQGLIEVGAPTQFCCAGCRTVYGVIHALGATDYYRRLDGQVAASRPAPTGRGFGEMDDPAFLAAHARAAGGGALAVDLQLEGMHCGACVWLVEKLPRFIAGVIEARVDVGRRRVRLVFDPARVALSAVAQRLDSLGYPPHVRRGADRDAARRDAERAHLVRIGVAFACAGNAMLLSFALWGGAFSGMDGPVRLLLRGASLLLTVIAVVFPGRVFFKGAWSSLRARSLHMDVPVAIALAIGTLWGGVNTWVDRGEVYFESLTAVIFLLVVGRWVQFRQQRAAEDALELLYAATPGVVRRVTDGEVKEVALEAIGSGDVVEVRAGDVVPADGVLLTGPSDFDLALLTGESRPVRRQPGDRVLAGAGNLGSAVRLRVEAAGDATRLGQLMDLVARFAADKPPIVRLADRLAHRFVQVVLALAAITLVAWWPVDPARAIENAVALLIVTCPCSLGLATPLAVQAAIGRAARRGILIKGGAALERLAGGGVLLVDKTGTITAGRMGVVATVGDRELLRQAAALERTVAHPIARALIDAFDPAGITVDDAHYVPGAGLRGRVAGHELWVGTAEFVAGGQALPSEVTRAIANMLKRAASPVVVRSDDGRHAVVGLCDPLRAEAPEALATLAGLGFEVSMLSGDHAAVARAVGDQIGLAPARVIAGVDPEGKVAAVRAALATGRSVVMVGDGINDAAAIAAAGVGVAVKGGAEASLAAADVYLVREGLMPLVELVQGARRTVGVIRRNLTASLLYNVLSASLAIAGVIHPLVAGVLMPLSSLTVVVLSYRSRTFDGVDRDRRTE